MYEHTIPGHYIVGNGSYSIPPQSLKVSGWHFKSENKIFKFFNFWSKKCSFLATFWPKIENLENFILWLEMSSCIFRRLWGDAITSISYNIVLKSCFRIQSLVHTQNKLFSRSKFIWGDFSYIQSLGCQYVASKVIIRWPNFRIWMYTF